MRRFRLTLTIICIFCLPANLIAAAVPARPIAIITGKTPTLTSISPSKLKLIYLRKQRYWPKGVPIKPVNLNSTHPLRNDFSQRIIGKAPRAQTSYWNNQYFNGILPPYVVNSQEAVIRYVSNTKGAIGYVDACEVDDRVITVGWITKNQIHTQAPPNLHCP